MKNLILCFTFTCLFFFASLIVSQSTHALSCTGSGGVCGSWTGGQKPDCPSGYSLSSGQTYDCHGAPGLPATEGWCCLKSSSGGSCGSGPSSCGTGEVKIGPGGTCSSNSQCSGSYNWCHSGCCFACVTPTPNPGSGGSCRSNSYSCTSNSQCCSNNCQSGVCRAPSSGGGGGNTGPSCGNGMCETGESALSCPSDCGSGGGGGNPPPGGGGQSLTVSTGSCGGRINLSWTSVSGATEYQIRRAPGNTSSWTIRWTGNTSTSYVDSGLNPGQSYRYTVRARLSNGSLGTLSAERSAVASSNCTSTPTPTRTPTPINRSITAGVFIDNDGNGQWQTSNDIQVLGRLIVDHNRNGKYDPAEPAGPRTRVTLERLISSNNWSTVSSAYTSTSGSSNGTRQFTGLSTGRYRIQYSQINSNYSPSPTYTSSIITINNTNPQERFDLALTEAPRSTESPKDGQVVSNNTGVCSLTDAQPHANVRVTINNNATPPLSWTDVTDGSGNYSITVSDDPTNEHFISILPPGNFSVQCVILVDNNGNETIVNSTNPSYPIDFPGGDKVVFVLGETKPWFMTDIGSVRQPRIQNLVPEGKLPTAPIVGSSNTSSIFYSTTGVTDLGSVSGVWKVDNEYQQAGLISREGNASFSFYKQRQEQNSGVEKITLPGCQLGNCNFTADLSSLIDQSFYYVAGDLYFDPQGVSRTINSNSRIIILAEGNITINKNVSIEGGRSLLIFSAKGDINITEEVGESNPSSTSPNIQAILSAENNINIQSIANCPETPDKRLNIEGTLIANADNPFGIDSSGGKLNNQRTLCAQDANNPVLYVKPRLSFITTLTDFYKVSTSIWNEIEP